MGVKPFLLAPSLNAIIGQRLTRKIHQDCKEEISLDAETLERVKKLLLEVPPNSGETVAPPEQWKFYRGKGCTVCNNTGYKGRVGIYELLLMTDEVRAALSEKIDEYQVRQLAKTQGMVTMQQDGMLKCLDGLTTVDEVLRVAGEGI
jgi:type II secretory ATPase GspE/PulE/Tfp pilus assembly ATPase PilB-like protein